MDKKILRKLCLMLLALPLVGFAATGGVYWAGLIDFMQWLLGSCFYILIGQAMLRELF